MQPRIPGTNPLAETRSESEERVNKQLRYSQKDLILKYIQDFGSITAYESFIELGITQLATRIYELKEKGYEFKTSWIYKKNRYGNPIKFCKYELCEE